ncbi:MAG: hypothetical protein ACREPY_14265 [Rhodanobacteraceae bacterium]
MSVYSVFNIGSGHTSAEPNNTIASLFNHCTGGPLVKCVNDGPSTLAAGMEAGVSRAIGWIKSSGATTLNMTGHSRGAVMCHMIANDIAAASRENERWAQRINEINMILLDPVNMSRRGDRAKSLSNGVKLGRYVALTMENVNGTSGSIFPSLSVSTSVLFNRKLIFLPLPGTHGSGTQFLTSAIGRSAYSTIMRFMSAWGTTFDENPTSAAICECYAGIHVENPVTYNKKGIVTKRLISDDAKGFATSVTDPSLKVGWQSRGRVKTITANFERMARSGTGGQTDFTDTPYFFNEFHFSAFGEAFPQLYARMARSRAQWKGKVPPGDSPVGVNVELDLIERRYPDIWKSFQDRFMV